MFDCEFCGKSFKNKSGLSQHVKYYCDLNPDKIDIISKKREKIRCRNCGKFFDSSVIKRHENCCINGYASNKTPYLDHDDLFCRYCGKECKHRNSLTQHEIRCKENPNRIKCDSFPNYIKEHIKGKTKESCESIKKQSETMKRLYADGLIQKPSISNSSLDNIYKEHNNAEIAKWVQYVRSNKYVFNKYELVEDGKLDSYNYIKHPKKFLNEDISYLFEHEYIMSVVFNVSILEIRKHTIHHLDENKRNNNLENLILFRNKSDHARYHISKYTKLKYNEDDHMFDCVYCK